MAGHEYFAAFPPQAPTNGTGSRVWQGAHTRSRPRYWVHAVLFGLTIFSTTLVGARLWQNFEANRAPFDVERDLEAFLTILRHPSLLVDGLPFSLTLLTVLLAHEMGHYLACLWYRIDASLPYFLPAPTFIGTFGAFIRIRSPIYSKRALFDIGVAGPLAGFVFLLPALAIGLSLSKVIPGIAGRGDVVFGHPPVVWVLQALIFPGVSPDDIYLHPIARAAWVGVLATALNLLPIGQLDGGHILYAFVGDRHRTLSRIFISALIPIGVFFWYGWLLWAGFFLLFGLRHPPTIYDTADMGRARWKLGWLALLILALTFTAAPFRTGD